MPLDLYIEGQACFAFRRTAEFTNHWNLPSTVKSKMGHRQVYSSYLSELVADNVECDLIPDKNVGLRYIRLIGTVLKRGNPTPAVA